MYNSSDFYVQHSESTPKSYHSELSFPLITTLSFYTCTSNYQFPGISLLQKSTPSYEQTQNGSSTFQGNKNQSLLNWMNLKRSWKEDRGAKECLRMTRLMDQSVLLGGSLLQRMKCTRVRCLYLVMKYSLNYCFQGQSRLNQSSRFQSSLSLKIRLWIITTSSTNWLLVSSSPMSIYQQPTSTTLVLMLSNACNMLSRLCYQTVKYFKRSLTVFLGMIGKSSNFQPSTSQTSCSSYTLKSSRFFETKLLFLGLISLLMRKDLPQRGGPSTATLVDLWFLRKGWTWSWLSQSRMVNLGSKGLSY